MKWIQKSLPTFLPLGLCLFGSLLVFKGWNGQRTRQAQLISQQNNEPFVEREISQVPEEAEDTPVPQEIGSVETESAEISTEEMKTETSSAQTKSTENSKPNFSLQKPTASKTMAVTTQKARTKKQSAPVDPELDEQFEKTSSHQTSVESESTKTSVERPQFSENSELRDFWVWFGAGGNLMSYSQSISGMSDVKFGQINAPLLKAQTGFFLSEHIGAQLEVESVAGNVKASPSVNVNNPQYRQNHFSAELMYRPERLPRQQGWLLKAGFHLQQFPFSTPINTNTITIHEMTVNTASVGLEYKSAPFREGLRAEYSLRYQHPLSASLGVGSDLKLKAKMMVDGSVGAVYQLSPHMNLGAFWGIQYHQFGFDYRDNNGTSTGQQDLIFSNFDLRLGVEF